MPQAKIAVAKKLAAAEKLIADNKFAAAELRNRRRRANQWKMFRKNHMFTQRRLADIVGISRRTIQQIEGAKITPHPATLSKFLTFRRKHERKGSNFREK